MRAKSVLAPPVAPRDPRSDSFTTTSHAVALFVAIASLALIVLFLFLGIYQNEAGYIYLSFAIAMPLIPIMVGLMRRHRFDLFEPINIAAAAIFYGTTLRGFYLVFGAERKQAKFLMMFQTFEDVNRLVVWILLGVVLFCAGYLVRIGRWRIEEAYSVKWLALDCRKLNALLLAALAVTLVSTVLYVAYFDIRVDSNLIEQSYKRSAEYVDESGRVVYGSSWQLQLALIGLYATFVLAAAMITRLVKATPYSLGLLAALALGGAFVPFISQSRTPIIILIFNVLALAYYYRRVKIGSVVLGLMAVVTLVAGMGILREVNSFNRRSDDVLDATLGTGNGFDAVRSTAILDRVPERADFLLGKSYAAAPFFFIPRAVWPDKPSTSLGPWVRTELFGVWSRNAGWPPGFVAESYVNFGYLGIFIMPFVIGVIMRAIYETFRPLLGVSFQATVLYIAGLYPMAFNTIELNVAQGFTLSMSILMPVAIILRLSLRPRALPAGLRSAETVGLRPLPERPRAMGRAAQRRQA